MTRPKYTKPDANQDEIVKELRYLGFDVDIICNVPGLYDIVVTGEKFIPNHVQCHYTIPCALRVEIKNPDNEPFFTDAEIKYYEKMIHKDCYLVANCTRDILRWFNGK